MGNACDKMRSQYRPALPVWTYRVLRPEAGERTGDTPAATADPVVVQRSGSPGHETVARTFDQRSATDPRTRRRPTTEGSQMIERQCTKCGKVKPLEQFPRHKDHPDGYVSTCKACRNRRVRDQRRRGAWK